MKRDILRVFSTNLIKTLVSIMMIFLVPLLLSVEQYGYYKLFVLYASYIGISHFGFCDGIFLKYGGKNIEQIDMQILSSEQKAFLVYELFWSTTVSLFGILEHDAIIFLFGMSFLPTTMVSFYTLLYQALGLFRQYSKIGMVNSLLMFILNSVLVLLLKADRGIYYILVNVLVNYIVFLFTIFGFNRRHIIKHVKFSFRALMEPMRLGILLMLGNMSYIIFINIDKWFVKGFMGMEYFSYYSFSGQLLSVINMFINPIGLTFYTYMSRRREKDFEYTLKIRMVSLLFFMLTIVFVAKFFIEHFIDKYMEAIPVIEILFFAQIFLLLNTSIYVNLYKVYQMQKKYFFNLIVVFTISVISNFIFYKIIGNRMESFAYATLLSMLIWSFRNLRNFPYLGLQRNVWYFIIFCSFFYFVANQFKNSIYGGILYFVCWFFALRVYMKESFDYYIKQLLMLKWKVSGN